MTMPGAFLLGTAKSVTISLSETFLKNKNMRVGAYASLFYKSRKVIMHCYSEISDFFVYNIKVV